MSAEVRGVRYLMMKTISVSNTSIHVSIHVVEIEADRFTVHVFLNGVLDASYAIGSREFAEGLAKCIADGDDARSYCREHC